MLGIVCYLSHYLYVNLLVYTSFHNQNLARQSRCQIAKRCEKQTALGQDFELALTFPDHHY